MSGRCSFIKQDLVEAVREREDCAARARVGDLQISSGRVVGVRCLVIIRRQGVCTPLSSHQILHTANKTLKGTIYIAHAIFNGGGK